VKIETLKKFAEKLGYELKPKMVRVCPKCGSHKVTMFTSDDDICGDCGKYFPAVGKTDLSKLK
jgi:ribosomal protein L37AE/L43A